VSLKIFILILFLPVILFASDYNKIISNFNVSRPITLIGKDKKFETIKPGSYKIMLQKDPSFVTLWFRRLDKEFRFNVPPGKYLSENFTLMAKVSGQPYTLTVFNQTKKRKLKDYVESIETVCKIDEAVKFEEECHPKIKWVPFEYRKLAVKKSGLYCYKRPSLAVRWGKRMDRIFVTIYSKTANIDLVDSRKSEIVASAHYRNTETHKKVWKKGQCR